MLSFIRVALALPVHGKYRSGCLQSSIGWSTKPPMKEQEKVLRELKGFAAPKEEQDNQYPQTSLGLNHQSKKTHGGTHGSSCICSRGWPSRSSMGGEVLGPVKALCPSIGECQGQEAGVGGFGSRGGGIGDFQRGSWERG